MCKLCDAFGKDRETQDRRLADFGLYQGEVEKLMLVDEEWKARLEAITQRAIIVGLPEATFANMLDCFGNGTLPTYALEEMKDFAKKLIRTTDKAVEILHEQILVNTPVTRYH